jgi:hypothetical protein
MTQHGIRQLLGNVIICTLVAGLGAPPSVRAQAHVVSPEELQAAVMRATQARQKNLETVVSFLSTAKAEKALRTARLDVKQVKSAVSTLNDEELARLAARAAKAQADFAAGRLSDRDLLWIVLGVAALILIIVAVD